jgi:hypothetical protein
MYRKALTNNGVYQKWDNFPQSPVSIEDYPYQMIAIAQYNYGLPEVVHLGVSPTPFYYEEYGEYPPNHYFASATPIVDDAVKQYKLENGIWVDTAMGIMLINHINYFYTALQCNYPVFTDSIKATILLNKTTNAQQDAGLIESWVRVN